MPFISAVDFQEDETGVRIAWSSQDANGAAVTATGGTVRVYKNGDTTEHTTTGITDTRDMDAKTGAHLITIDTSAHAFFEVDAEYLVLLDSATIAGQTVTAWLGGFTIGQTDVYGARIFYIKTSASVQYICVPSIEFNGQSLAAADISNIEIRVFNMLTGADIVAAVAMTRTTGEDAWYHTLDSGAGATLLSDGVPYAAELQFDHLGRTNRTTFREGLFKDAV